MCRVTNNTTGMVEAGGQEEAIMNRVGAIHVVDTVRDIHMMDKVMLVHLSLVEEDEISGIETSSMDTMNRIAELDIFILEC